MAAPTFLYKIRQLLSGKYAGYICITVCIMVRVIQLVFFYNLRVDASYQMQATQNLVLGHGITTAQVLPSDLSTTIYEPLIKWPPGYSLLTAPFYILFGHNYIAAGLALGIICAIALLFASRGILKILRVPGWLINIQSLLTSFFIYHFYFIVSTDAIAISFLALALYLTLLLLKKGDLKPVLLFTLFACLVICAYIKYLFIPIALVIPGFLIIRGFAGSQKKILTTGIIAMLCIGLSIGALFAYQKVAAGSPAYVAETGRGFFPEHLLDVFPALPNSIIKQDTVMILSGQESISRTFLRAYQVLHAVLLVFILVYGGRRIYRRGFVNLSLPDSFLYLSFFISLVNMLTLLGLSLFVAKEQSSQGVWTYVEEARYYGTVAVLLHLVIFSTYGWMRNKKSPILRYAPFLLILLLTVEMLRGAVFVKNRVELLGREEYRWQREDRFQKFAEKIIQSELRVNPVNKVVATGSLYYMNNRIALHSQVPVLAEADKINYLPDLNTKEPVLLIVAIYDKHTKAYEPFLNSKEKKYHGSIVEFSFYTVYVTPN